MIILSLGLNKNQESLYIVPFQEFNKLKRKCIHCNKVKLIINDKIIHYQLLTDWKTNQAPLNSTYM